MKIQKVSEIDYACGWNRYTMDFIGIWPNERSLDQISSYKVLTAVCLMFCFICLPQTINLFFIWTNFNLVVENLSMGNISVTIALLKTIFFWLNGQSLKYLLSLMEEDQKAATTEEESKTIRNTVTISRKISIRSTLMCLSVVIVYTILRYVTILHTGRNLLFRAYFPYDTRISPNYELTFIAQLIAAFYAATSYTAVDTFIAMLVLHICGQLSNLKRELINLRSKNGDEFKTKLTNIVEKHDYLNRFVDTIENRFHIMLLIQILGCTVQLCFQCFQALLSYIEGPDELFILEVSFLMLYICYVLIQLYLYCYVGERLLSESTDILQAVYDCEWYNLTPKESKSLLMIMYRARSPLYLSAGKFCIFTLELYSSILKTSMGYISVLYAIKIKTST
ncbi:odorant receptor 13a-like [Polistes fuscatus]|uniref:odorant receptor 13a-like n=1 Tax=Polistes fuscatus TaxID=30207 RepID=UPI001CA9FC2E|nr:odorant receptor 13a-like [Polistes fuscatus]